MMVECSTSSKVDIGLLLLLVAKTGRRKFAVYSKLVVEIVGSWFESATKTWEFVRSKD